MVYKVNKLHFKVFHSNVINKKSLWKLLYYGNIYTEKEGSK